MIQETNKPTVTQNSKANKMVPTSEVNQVTETSEQSVASTQPSQETPAATQLANSPLKEATPKEPTVILPKEWHYLQNHWLQGIMQAAMSDEAHPDIPNLEDYKYTPCMAPDYEI